MLGLVFPLLEADKASATASAVVRRIRHAKVIHAVAEEDGQCEFWLRSDGTYRIKLRGRQMLVDSLKTDYVGRARSYVLAEGKWVEDSIEVPRGVHHLLFFLQALDGKVKLFRGPKPQSRRLFKLDSSSGEVTFQWESLYFDLGKQKPYLYTFDSEPPETQPPVPARVSIRKFELDPRLPKRWFDSSAKTGGSQR